MATILNPTIYKIKRLKSIAQWLVEVPQSSWYYQMKASKHYDELTLQRVLLYKFKNLVPNHSAIYYNKDIVSTKSPFDKCKPDFILWDNNYTKWYIIEVELENHNIEHIRKQLNTFYNGDYRDYNGITAYVKRKYPSLDEKKFENLIRSVAPQIILMADEIRHEWYSEFATISCIFSTLQVYSDERDNILYRIGGDFPQEYVTFSYCTLNKHIRALDIHNPLFLDAFKLKNNDLLKLYYRGTSDDWEFINQGGAAMLLYPGPLMPLDETHSRWKLILTNRNQLHIIK